MKQQLKNSKVSKLRALWMYLIPIVIVAIYGGQYIIRELNTNSILPVTQQSSDEGGSNLSVSNEPIHDLNLAEGVYTAACPSWGSIPFGYSATPCDRPRPEYIEKARSFNSGKEFAAHIESLEYEEKARAEHAIYPLTPEQFYAGVQKGTIKSK